MPASGIYILEFPGGERYVGQSLNVDTRIDKHLNDISKGIHPNKLIRECYAQYDVLPEASVLEYCAPEDMNAREIYYIEAYDSYHNGLNQTRGGGVRRNRMPSSITSHPTYKKYSEFACTRENKRIIFKAIAKNRDLTTEEVSLLHTGVETHKVRVARAPYIKTGLLILAIILFGVLKGC